MNSEIALYTKARALYGRRLRTEDYRQLLQKQNVGQVAAYLKDGTCYANTLREVRPELVHRGQLEHLLRRYPVDACTRLLHYAAPEGITLRLFVMRYEMECLLDVLRRPARGEAPGTSPPPLLEKRFGIDLRELERATDFTQVLASLRRSPYYQALSPFAERPQEPLLLETAVLSCYFRRALDLARRGAGDAGRQLERLLRMQVDLYNVLTLYRLRRTFGITAQELPLFLIPVKGLLSAGVYRSLTECDPADMHTLLQSQLLTKRFLSGAENDITLGMQRMRRQHGQRWLRFGSQPAVALMSFVLLTDIQTSNIISVVEGIRYGLPPEEIEHLLVLERGA